MAGNGGWDIIGEVVGVVAGILWLVPYLHTTAMVGLYLCALQCLLVPGLV